MGGSSKVNDFSSPPLHRASACRLGVERGGAFRVAQFVSRSRTRTERSDAKERSDRQSLTKFPPAMSLAKIQSKKRVPKYPEFIVLQIAAAFWGGPQPWGRECRGQKKKEKAKYAFHCPRPPPSFLLLFVSEGGTQVMPPPVPPFLPTAKQIDDHYPCYRVIYGPLRRRRCLVHSPPSTFLHSLPLRRPVSLCEGHWRARYFDFE